VRHHDPRHPEQEVAAALPRSMARLHRPRHHPEGDHFIFRSKFLSYRGGGSPAGQRMNNFFPGKTSDAPQSATSNSPVLSPPGCVLRHSTLRHISVLRPSAKGLLNIEELLHFGHVTAIPASCIRIVRQVAWLRPIGRSSAHFDRKTLRYAPYTFWLARPSN
jgi:hypothetical protein